MKMRINKMNLMVILLWIAIFPFYTRNEKIFYIYQFVVAIVIAISTISELKNIPGKFFLCFYPIVIVVSCVLNRSIILYTQVFRGGTLALLILDIFLLLHKYIRTRSGLSLFNIFYRLSSLYVIINILWVFALVLTGGINDAIQNNFLFSKSKFTVAYTCVFFLMFYCIVWSGNKLFPGKYKKTIFILLSLICIALCMMVQTATGAIALALFMILMLVPRKILKRINNPVILIALILASMWIIFSLSLVVSLPPVQRLITNVFHKDLTLTGRLHIYELLSPLLFRSGFLGSGFGSYVAQSLGEHGWYNAQNGLAETILTYGFLGAGSFLILVFISSYYSKGCVEPINAAILVFIIVAIVEIPFTERFAFLLALLMFADASVVKESERFPNFLKIVFRRKEQ